MCPYRHLRTYGLASILVLAIPLTGGCGTEVDGSGDDSAAIAAAPATLDDALSTLTVNCSAERTRLACAPTAAMLDCSVRAQGATRPTAVRCCGLPQGQPGVEIVSCAASASGDQGVVRPQGDGPGLND
jgi:hypothetical protein